MSKQSFQTVAAPAECEIDKVKGSRFLGFVWPVTSEAQAMEHVDGLRKRYHDARHWCWAWRLGRGSESFRYQDDGEPSGTAGRPILQEIDGRELTDVLVVVVRYFGGTKLGTGGLARAYADAARETLSRAKIRIVRIDRPVRIHFGYEDTAAIQALMHRYAEQPIESSYQELTMLLFSLPTDRAEAFAESVTEATSGRARIEIGPEGPSPGQKRRRT